MLPQPFDRPQDRIHIIRQGAFRNLNADHGRRNLIFLYQVDKMFRDVREIEIHPGHIHGNRHRLDAPLPDIADPPGHAFPHAAVDLENIAGFFQHRHKPGRRNQLPFVVPACQRLAADDLAAFHHDLGLDVENEFPIPQPVLHIQHHHLVFPLVLVVFLAVEMVTPQELALDILQRPQGPVIHGRHRLPPVRGKVDAQHRSEPFRAVQHTVNSIRFRDKIPVILFLCRQDRTEHITAGIPADTVKLLRNGPHHVRQVLQIGVARLAAENIII